MSLNFPIVEIVEENKNSLNLPFKNIIEKYDWDGITRFDNPSLNNLGQLHSYDDIPNTNKLGDKEWWKNGLRHRDGDKPAVEKNLKSTKEYWKNGLRHRDGDKPAIETNSVASFYMPGGQHLLSNQILQTYWWFKNGEMVRGKNKPNKVITKLSEKDGIVTILHFINEWHNEYGLHNEKSFAVEKSTGEKEYWINGNQLSEENFLLNKELSESLKVNKKNTKSKI